MSEVNEKKGKGNVEQKMRSKEGREIKKEEKRRKRKERVENDKCKHANKICKHYDGMRVLLLAFFSYP